MLVSLSEMKSYLGITSSAYDTFLNEQIALVSDVVEAYCRRKFLSAEYAETIYRYDREVCYTLETFHFPLVEVASITEDDVLLSDTEYRINLAGGYVIRPKSLFFIPEKTVIQYTAGYDSAPTPVKSVVFSTIEERYNKKTSGVDLNFGSDVQRISIPGAISIDFDYSLNNNDRTNSFGAILGSRLNILDYYRSNRAIVGSDRITYIEDVPSGP